MTHSQAILDSCPTTTTEEQSLAIVAPKPDSSSVNGGQHPSVPLPEQRGSIRWEIEDFSRQGDKIYSDVFSTGPHEWRVIVYPRGNKSEDLSLYLDSVKSTLLPPRVAKKAHFTLSIINQLDPKKSFLHSFTNVFNKVDQSWGWTTGTVHLVDIMDESKGFKIDDVVIVECHVQVVVLDEPQMLKDDDDIFLYEQEGSIRFPIKNFSKFEDKKILFSDSFVSGDHKWKLSVYPKGNDSEDLSLYLEAGEPPQLPCNTTRKALFVLAIENQIDIKKSFRQTFSQYFTKSQSSWGLTTGTVKLSAIAEETNGWKTDDSVVVAGHVQMATHAVDYNSRKETGYVGVIRGGSEKTHLNIHDFNCARVSDRLAALLQELFFCAPIRCAVYDTPSEDGSFISELQKVFFGLQFCDTPVSADALSACLSSLPKAPPPAAGLFEWATLIWGQLERAWSGKPKYAVAMQCLGFVGSGSDFDALEKGTIRVSVSESENLVDMLRAAIFRARKRESLARVRERRKNDRDGDRNREREREKERDNRAKKNLALPPIVHVFISPSQDNAMLGRCMFPERLNIENLINRRRKVRDMEPDDEDWESASSGEEDEGENENENENEDEIDEDGAGDESRLKSKSKATSASTSASRAKSKSKTKSKSKSMPIPMPMSMATEQSKPKGKPKSKNRPRFSHIYELHSVVVSTTDKGCRHFFKPCRSGNENDNVNDERWYRFEAGTVVRVSQSDAIDANFGGNGFDYDLAGNPYTCKPRMTASMLVYISSNLVEHVLRYPDQSDVPSPLSTSLFDSSLARVRVATGSSICVVNGYEVVDFSQAGSLIVPRNLTVAQFRTLPAMRADIAPKRLHFWICRHHDVGKGRTSSTLALLEGEGDDGGDVESKKSKNKSKSKSKGKGKDQKTESMSDVDDEDATLYASPYYCLSNSSNDSLLIDDVLLITSGGIFLDIEPCAPCLKSGATEPVIGKFTSKDRSSLAAYRKSVKLDRLRLGQSAVQFPLLHLAAAEADARCVQQMVRSGMDALLRHYAYNGATPLHMAAEHGRKHIISALCDPIQLHPGVSAPSRDHEVLLLGSSATSSEGQDKDKDNSDSDSDKVVFSRSAIDAVDVNGLTPLHYAVKVGHLGSVEALLEHNAPYDASDRHGNTPLHYACLLEQESIATALILRGANKTAENADGKTPLDLVPTKELRQTLKSISRRVDQSKTKSKSKSQTSDTEPSIEPGKTDDDTLVALLADDVAGTNGPASAKGSSKKKNKRKKKKGANKEKDQPDSTSASTSTDDVNAKAAPTPAPAAVQAKEKETDASVEPLTTTTHEHEHEHERMSKSVDPASDGPAEDPEKEKEKDKDADNNRLNALAEELDGLRRHIADLHEFVPGLELEIEQLKNENSRLLEMRDATVSSEAAARAENEQLRRGKALGELAYNELRQENMKLREEMGLGSLEARIAAEHSRLRKDNDRLGASLRQAVAQLHSLRFENERLGGTVAALQSEIEIVRSQSSSSGLEHSHFIEDFGDVNVNDNENDNVGIDGSGGDAYSYNMNMVNQNQGQGQGGQDEASGLQRRGFFAAPHAVDDDGWTVQTNRR